MSITRFFSAIIPDLSRAVSLYYHHKLISSRHHRVIVKSVRLVTFLTTKQNRADFPALSKHFYPVRLSNYFILEHLIFQLRSHIDLRRKQCPCDQFQVVGLYVCSPKICVITIDADDFVVPCLHMLLLSGWILPVLPTLPNIRLWFRRESFLRNRILQRHIDDVGNILLTCKAISARKVFRQQQP